jgi:CBS domain containing-hemolysin-like protein
MGTMFTFLVVLTSTLFILLVVISSMRPAPSVISTYELERRSKRANREAKALLRRERYLPDILALQRIITTLLLVIVVLLSVVTFGWLIGVIVAVLVALEYGVIAKLPALGRASLRWYESLEPALLNFAQKFNKAFVFIRSVPMHSVDTYHRFDSREELQRLVDASGDILSEDERKLIVHSLGFKDQRVDSIMTPRSMMDTIKKGEFLGPLVLSELHDTGHSRLPVIGSDVDHVVGILHIKDLLSLDIKNSVTAEKAMEPKVYYIREDQSLEHALAAFLSTHHHLFIVINAQRETVGLLTLEDVIEALIGRRIIDEDDNHENLREIAAQNPHDNNSPEKHTDV